MLSSTIRPVVPVQRPSVSEIDNPAITRLLQLGIAAVIGTTLIVFHGALLAVAGSALPLA